MIAGLSLALLASLCFAAGNALEKHGVDHLPAFSARDWPRSVRGVATSRWWLGGATISVLGLAAQILALAHIAISIAQSIGVAGVVLLVVISRVKFDEHLHARELAGLATAIASLVLISFSLSGTGNAPGERGDTDDIVLVTVLVLVVVALSSPALRRDKRGFVYGGVAGLLYGLSAIGAKGLSILLNQDGVFGAFVHMFTTPFPYLLFGGWTLGLVIFQLGIQRCRIGLVGPLSSMVGSVFFVGVGTPVFGEHLPSQPALLVLRIVGFAGVVVGSALVSTGAGAVPAEQVPAISVHSRAEVPATDGGGTTES